MPPLLHPKSRMTSSLFATTVAACFIVVTIPHMLPCPVPRARFADGDIMVDEHGRRLRWKRKDTNPKVEDGIVQFNDICQPRRPKTHRTGPRGNVLYRSREVC
ncbi:hypothetical protein NXS19_013584 [Fusarium pseudograminearum]|nr:hypothetical protein NXS19_013584 [Fusarium pseudograminearum]